MLLNILPVVLFTLLFFQMSPAIPTIPPYAPQESATLDLPIPFYAPAARPIRTSTDDPPPFSAAGMIVMDLDTKTVLAAVNPHVPIPPASTTKIMTALIALESCALDDVVTVSDIDFDNEHTQMGLVVGEHITVEHLLYGLLLNSGNDAALALASHCGPGHAAFLERMNSRAKELGLKQSAFTNTTGLDNPHHVATPWDLATLAAYALRNPTFATIVRTEKYSASNVEQTRWHPLQNRNALLSDRPDVIGVKTGWTEVARDCLVVLSERDGHKIITVLLGSEDRFGETDRLLDWVWANHRWELR